MNKIKTRLFSIILCLAIAFSIVPVQADTTGQNLVTREQAIVSMLNTVGYGTLDETQNDLSAFSDADSITEEYIDEMAIAVTNGIIFGSGTTLDPQRNVTRLEFAMFLSRSIRELPVIKDDISFSDVPASAAGDVRRLARSGLFSGYGNGLFGVNDYMTKEQLDAVMGRVKDLKNVDLADDFYYSVNYNWLSATKLPKGYPSFGAFDEVSINNDVKLKEIAHEIYEKRDTYENGSVEQKLSDFYSTILDMENRNKQGIEPIKKYLDGFAGVKTAQELLDYLAEFENETGVNPMFSFSPSVDLLDSNKYSLYGQGLITGLPSAYYLLDNPQIQAVYEGYMAHLLMLSGVDQETAMVEASKVYEFEKIIAQYTMSSTESSKIENLYNPIKREELVQVFTETDLDKFIDDLGYKNVDTIIVPDVKLMVKTGELITDENVDVLKSYANVHLLMTGSQYLTKDFQDSLYAFNATFLGMTSTMADEDIAFSLLSSVMSSYLGRIYIEKYFPAEAKADVEEMVDEIIEVFKNRIERLDWMRETTREAAKEKLDLLTVKVGYPDEWPDPYKEIEINSYEEGGSLLGNIFAITSASAAYTKTLLDKPVDKSSWSMSPQTVNAYNNLLNNEIVFPAGILQAPFYDVNASREQNLGGIGAIIAHEITHAFDNNGSQFDGYGNMNNWWTEEDYQTFRQKCQDVIGLYDGLEIIPGAIVSGELTVSENVADIGGVACVLEIMSSIPDANYEEFFESNARIWRMTATPKTYHLLTQEDVHSPSKLRSNMVLRNFQEFYDTYDIDEDDYMYLAPEGRIIIW